jgi:hypothetical protein
MRSLRLVSAVCGALIVAALAALPQAFPLLFTSETKRHRHADDAKEDDAEEEREAREN